MKKVSRKKDSESNGNVIKSNTMNNVFQQCRQVVVIGYIISYAMPCHAMPCHAMPCHVRSLIVPEFSLLCDKYTPSGWAAARNGRFFKSANVGDGTGVVDTRHRGYQEPGATGSYGFCRMVGTKGGRLQRSLGDA